MEGKMRMRVILALLALSCAALGSLVVPASPLGLGPSPRRSAKFIGVLRFLLAAPRSTSPASSAVRMLEQQRLQLQQLLRAIRRPASLPAELLIA
jgi:hypothetical protein